MFVSIILYDFVWFIMIYMLLQLGQPKYLRIFLSFDKVGLAKTKNTNVNYKSGFKHFNISSQKWVSKCMIQFSKNKKKKTVILTEMGAEKVEVFSTCIEK